MPPSGVGKLACRGLIAPLFGPEWSVLPDQYDVDLVDHALLEELQMTTDLMAAANQSDAPLSLTDIDRILGVTEIVPRTGTPARGPEEPGNVAEPSSPQDGQIPVPRPRGGSGGMGQE